MLDCETCSPQTKTRSPIIHYFVVKAVLSQLIFFSGVTYSAKNPASVSFVFRKDLTIGSVYIIVILLMIYKSVIHFKAVNECFNT